MSVIRWLHISDLHLNKIGTESERLREQLPIYLRKLGTNCDYVFCTGDLRYAPYGKFLPDTIERMAAICDAVNVPMKRLFVTPGNHDVDRNATGRDLAIKRLFYRHLEDASGYYTAQEGVIKSEELKTILSAQKDYIEILQELFDEQSKHYPIETFGAHKVIKTEDLNVVIIDSTLSYMKEQQRDLIVGTYDLRRALKSLEREKVSVALTHYSFDFLDRKEQEIVFSLLRDSGVRLWLSGHEHDRLCRKQRDYFYEFQTGNLMLESGAKACVIIGQLDTESLEGKIEIHAWFSPDGWAVYPFAGAGRSESTYLFNLRDEECSFEQDKEQKRRELRKQIMPILMENRGIFEAYGPTDENRSNLWNERVVFWGKMIQDTILPNSFKIIELLESRKELLRLEELDVLEKYKMHIYGLALNHNGNGGFVIDAPRFPEGILSILE